MVKLKEVTTLTQKQNARHFTSVVGGLQGASSSTASSVLMDLFSTKNISSVTGGSTWIVLRLRVSTFLMRKLLLKEKQTHQVRDNMTEVLGEVVDKEHTKDHREKTQDPEDHQTETTKDLHLVPQDILVLLPLSTTTILLPLDSVQMLDMERQVVLETVTELLAEQTLGMEPLQELVQGTLLLVRPMLVFNHPEAAQGRGQGKDLESRDLLGNNALN